MKNLLLISAIFASLVIGLIFVSRSSATVDPNIAWCHCAESGVCNTLFLPQAALENAGHVNAQGNPLHAGDHLGACVETTPTLTPSPTPICDNEEQDCVTPTPTETLTPTPTETLTPTPTNTPPGTGGPGDGLSDGRSDGRSSCPECTQAPRQGQVLGASTFAPTGTFGSTAATVEQALGILLSAGGVAYAQIKAKKKSKVRN